MGKDLSIQLMDVVVLCGTDEDGELPITCDQNSSVAMLKVENTNSTMLALSKHLKMCVRSLERPFVRSDTGTSSAAAAAADNMATHWPVNVCAKRQ